MLLAQNVIKTACSRCNWFFFSLDENLAGDLLANRYVWQLQSRNYFRQSFENCTNSNDNLLSTKVKSGSIVVGIVKEKNKGKSILATVNRLYILSIAFISCLDPRGLAFTQVTNIWLGCCAPGSFMAVWRLPEAPFTCNRPIPLSCALRNSAFGLQVRVISRQYTKSTKVCC